MMALVLKGDGSVGPLSPTEMGYLDGVTGQISTRLPDSATLSSGGGIFTQFCGVKTGLISDNTARAFATILFPQVASGSACSTIKVDLAVTQPNWGYCTTHQLWAFGLRAYVGGASGGAAVTTPSKIYGVDGGSDTPGFLDMTEGTLTATVSAPSYGQSTVTLKYTQPAITGSGSSGNQLVDIFFAVTLTGLAGTHTFAIS